MNNNQQRSQQRRLWIVLLGLSLVMLIIIGRLVLFQVYQGDAWSELVVEEVPVIANPERGTIYDRNGTVLAANSSDYRVGVSPNLITSEDEASAMTTDLISLLETGYYDVYDKLHSERPFEVLHGRVSPDVAELIRARDYDAINLEPLPRRFYPQGELLCQTLGYVDFDGNGAFGLEKQYQEELAGEVASAQLNLSPLTMQQSVIAREGADLVLTIDRSVQYLVEQHLTAALREHGAPSGTIIVMDPRTGAILALANAPCFSPYHFFEAADEKLLKNPAVSDQFEPGSVMKLMTMAAALDSGTVTPQSTYYDQGVLEVGGHLTYNWDRAAYGTTDMTTLLARSLNVGAATLATWMGTDTFYDYLLRFGFGKPTGIDLAAETGGLMPLPGDELWTDSFLATNAYGQALATTSLQMIAAVSALANDGEMMQPYLVEEVRSTDNIYTHNPTVLSRPISRETAQQMTTMAVAAVAREVPEALVTGYTIAGKTGTAQIPENGVYLENEVIGTFVGWLPADNPEIIVYVKLDRPRSAPWGSKTAAPTFAKLVEELVVLLDIPPDTIRLQADIAALRQRQEQP